MAVISEIIDFRKIIQAATAIIQTTPEDSKKAAKRAMKKNLEGG